MQSRPLLSSALSVLLAVQAIAQVTLTGTNNAESASSTGADYATGSELTYLIHDSTSTRLTTTTYGTVLEASSTASETANSTVTSSSATRTVLVGGQVTTSTVLGNGTALRNSTATSSALPINTQPCNGHPEFCERKFSNITYVAAHNSPFVREGNAASNQELPVATQLEDGIRMRESREVRYVQPQLILLLVQFQTHNINGAMYLCHTSCDILNMGTLQDYLTIVTQWLRDHPYDVITILMGNYDVVSPQNYQALSTTPDSSTMSTPHHKSPCR